MIHIANCEHDTTQPLLSVVVPVYNVEQYLDRCVQSIVSQTYPNLEIILVDDGSTDMSGAICDRWEKKDKRIKIFHKTNGGLVSARQAGVALSTGEYVAQVDSDDWIESEMYQNLINLAVENNADMVTSGIIRDYDNGYSARIYEKIEQGVYRDEQLKKVWSNLVNTERYFESRINIHITNKIFKRNLILHHQLRLSPEAVICDDVAVVFPCIFDSKCVVFSGKCYYHYCIRNGSIMSSTKDMSISNQKVIDNLNLARKEYAELIPNIGAQVDRLVLYTRYFTELDNVLDIRNGKINLLSGICKHDRVILYGAGKFGQRLKQWLDKTDFCQVIAWCDQNCRGEIRSPKEALGMDYDRIIIAALDADIIDNMECKLLELGAERNKIVKVEV